MATQLPPIPNNPVTDTHVWRDWFFKVSQLLVQSAQIAWSSLDFTGSNLRDISVRQHNALQDLQGGVSTTEMYHLSATQYSNVSTLPTFGTIVTQNLGLTLGSSSFFGNRMPKVNSASAKSISMILLDVSSK